MFFCGKSSGNDAPTWRHFVCSLKKKDVGYCRKPFRERGSMLLTKREGGKLERIGPRKRSEHTSYSSFYNTTMYAKHWYSNNAVNNCRIIVCLLHFLGPFLSYFPPLFRLTTHSHSLQKTYRSNPNRLFSNCIRNDVTLVWLCLTTFCKKKPNCLLLSTSPRAGDKTVLAVSILKLMMNEWVYNFFFEVLTPCILLLDGSIFIALSYLSSNWVTQVDDHVTVHLRLNDFYWMSESVLELRSSQRFLCW